MAINAVFDKLPRYPYLYYSKGLLGMPGVQDTASVLIRKELDSNINHLEATLDADVLAYFGPIHFEADELVRQAVEERATRRNKLVVVLETDGGFAEVVERIVRVFRHHYDTIEYIVPDHAMSAGTILVMSGDRIHMDYYSILGPIDPQVPRLNGKGTVPALGYLDEYNRLVEKSSIGDLTTAEMAFLVQKFDPAELHDYKQAKELTISLLKEWLVQYKFRNWTLTETRRLEVTHEMKATRAEEIAVLLNQTTRWHSHGRGIPMQTVRDVLKLKIEDFSSNPALKETLMSYHRLLKNFMGKFGSYFVIHTPDTYISLPQ
jgi:hypothetical protein